MERARRAVEHDPIALTLRVEGVLVPTVLHLGGGAEGDAATEPLGQGVVVASQRAVGQRDLRTSVLVDHACRRLEQLGQPSRGQTHAGVDVEERVPTVTDDATVVDGRDVESLPLERLDRKPPQLDDAHRATLGRAQVSAPQLCLCDTATAPKGDSSGRLGDGRVLERQLEDVTHVVGQVEGHDLPHRLGHVVEIGPVALRAGSRCRDPPAAPRAPSA